MKFKTQLTLLATAALLAVGLAAQAQTNVIQPTLGGLTSTFADWIGSYDTNLSFQDVIVWDGPVYQDGVNFGNEFGGSYDVWRQNISTNNSGLASVGNKLGGLMFFAVEGRFRQGGIAGSWVSMAGGMEFGWMKYDFRAGLFLDGVYLNNPEAMNVAHRQTAEVGVFADKMMTKSSAVGIFISEQIYQKSPIIGANLNVSFGNGTGLFGLF